MGPKPGGYASAIADPGAALVSARPADTRAAAPSEPSHSSRLRQTAFMGEALRGSLLSAYQAWHLTTLVMALGGAVTGLGAALVATAEALGAQPRRA